MCFLEDIRSLIRSAIFFRNFTRRKRDYSENVKNDNDNVARKDEWREMKLMIIKIKLAHRNVSFNFSR